MATLIPSIDILRSHGYQTIKDIESPVLPEAFRGVPELDASAPSELREVAAAGCPTGALTATPFQLDLGKCLFCAECSKQGAVRFTNNYRLATNVRERLVIKAGEPSRVHVDAMEIRSEIRAMFGGSLKLRQVSAGGNNADELELNAGNNVNFDMGRYGIDFVASPRHADGIVITGPISVNMSRALQIAYDAVPDPKIVILAGTESISGGIWAGSPALDRSFLDRHKVDLYIPGNPIHPLSFVNGVLDLIRNRKKY